MIEVHWNPVWYGLRWAAAFIVGAALVRRWASRVQACHGTGSRSCSSGLSEGHWLAHGSISSSRTIRWRTPASRGACSQSGRAAPLSFGGLLGAIGAAWLYTRRVACRLA